MTKKELCPECGQDSIDRNEVDVGVGVMTSPSWCMACGWTEEFGADLSEQIEAGDEDLADALTEPDAIEELKS
jgi:predicted nucleic-acid-binding Zn-ribbon protein